MEFIGYQGFTTYKEFMCLDPLSYEKNLMLYLTKLFVLEKFDSAKKELFHNIPVKLGPALRFDHVHNKYKKKIY